MKFVLILMIRNEERILQRCLEAVESFVDDFCICDTGSTDKTCEIADEFLKTRKGCLTKTEWVNFGVNRSISFDAAQKYVEKVYGKESLKDYYGLLLDADMVFVPGTLKQQELTEPGYTLIQCAGNLEYPNTRLVRMDYPWKCRSVTHEYWDGPTSSLPKSVCYIDDRNDGGCKSDKFERDARLLEQGLKDEPNNPRYMFYLGQTYNSLGRSKESTIMYKNRILAGGWHEEIWYSMYMIAQNYQVLGDPIGFEKWMLKAYNFFPQRSESLYKLAKYFREKGENFKAYHYATLGKKIPIPDASLFVEKDVYEYLFDYELTVLNYYIENSEHKGLETSIKYLLKPYNSTFHNVYHNLIFYIKPLNGVITNHPIMRDEFGFDFHPTSVCFFEYNGTKYHNMRFVNYYIENKTGAYIMCDGTFSTDKKVRTENAIWNSKTVTKMKDSSVTLPRRDIHIIGLEDIRVYINKSNELSFLAVSWEYSDRIRVVNGKYNLDGTYSDCKVIESPYNAECEKNWIPVSGTDDIIYKWSPLEVGKIEDNQIKIHTSYKTPWFFEHLRGSTSPVMINNQWIFTVHFVHHSAPRKYFHCLVKCDLTYKPIEISLPFVFKTTTIEYCLGMELNQEKTEITFGFSTMDDNPRLITVPYSSFSWLQV